MTRTPAGGTQEASLSVALTISAGSFQNGEATPLYTDALPND